MAPVLVTSLPGGQRSAGLDAMTASVVSLCAALKAENANFPRC